MRARPFFAILLISGLSACGGEPEGPPPAEVLSAAAQAQRTLAGPWRVLEVQSIDSTGAATPSMIQESFVLFADGYYSYALTTGDQPTKPFANTDGWTGTEPEMLARFNAITANSGSFAATDSLLVTKPVFAKNPGFINGGAQYHYTVIGDTLTLTTRNVVTVAGVQNPIYAAGGHEVIKLVRVVR